MFCIGWYILERILEIKTYQSAIRLYNIKNILKRFHFKIILFIRRFQIMYSAQVVTFFSIYGQCAIPWFNINFYDDSVLQKFVNLLSCCFVSLTFIGNIKTVIFCWLPCKIDFWGLGIFFNSQIYWIFYRQIYSDYLFCSQMNCFFCQTFCKAEFVADSSLFLLHISSPRR